ncbi:MAG TPA: P-loop NTPase [Anaeromyxobacteraceae bacterium]|nr:P-loop NTPase [Anaeromyxobacteraceae bacterium]
MEKFSILLVAVKPPVEASLVASLGQPQGVRSYSDVSPARAALQQARPAVAVVSVSGPQLTDALELVGEAAGLGVPTVALAAEKDPELILAAMRAGAREFLIAGEEKQLERAVQGLLESSGAIKLGTVTAVLPAKGGVGSTVVATHLAGALARRDRRVCLADVDLELGDALAFLEVAGGYTFADVAANDRRLDRDLLDASVPRHSSGVWVLSQSEKVVEAERLGAEGVARVLRFLRHHYDHVVLDGLRGFGDLALASLDLADRIVLLVTQEVPAVRAAQRRVELLRQLGYDASRIVVAVNRYHRGASVSRQVIEETLQLPVAATIGNDFRTLTRAVNRGVLVWEESKRSPIAQDCEEFAELLDGGAAEPASEGLLSRLFYTKVVLNGA